MNPEQLRRLAELVRRDTPAPAGFQSMQEYVASLVVHRLADALGDLADEVAADVRPGTVPGGKQKKERA